MRSPLVSVIMPVYNGEKYIHHAIESVLRQTLKNFELIIVNDGSKDKTIKEILKFPDPRIVLINSPTNQGLIKSLNIGISKSKASYIARLDSEDISYPTRFEEQYEELNLNKSIGLVTCWSEVIDVEGKVKNVSTWDFSSGAFYYILHFRNCIAHSSVMFKKQIAEKFGCYSKKAKYNEDFDLWNKISKVSRIFQIKKILLKWREHKENISTKFKKEMLWGARITCSEQIKKLINKKLNNELIEALADCQNMSFLSKKDINIFINVFPQITNTIYHRTPEFLDKEKMKQYIAIEMCKYGNILRELGFIPEKFLEEKSSYEKIFGYLYYLSRYKKKNFLLEIIPKTHIN